jgi:hypothetical protein
MWNISSFFKKSSQPHYSAPSSNSSESRLFTSSLSLTRSTRATSEVPPSEPSSAHTSDFFTTESSFHSSQSTATHDSPARSRANSDVSHDSRNILGLSGLLQPRSVSSSTAASPAHSRRPSGSLGNGEGPSKLKGSTDNSSANANAFQSSGSSSKKHDRRKSDASMRSGSDSQ